MMNYVNYFIHIVKTMLPIVIDSIRVMYVSFGARVFFRGAILIAVIIVEQKITEYIYEQLPINKPAQVAIRIVTFIIGFVIYATVLYFEFINTPNKFVGGIDFMYSLFALIEIARIFEAGWGIVLYLIFKLIKAIKEDMKW